MEDHQCKRQLWVRDISGPAQARLVWEHIPRWGQGGAARNWLFQWHHLTGNAELPQAGLRPHEK